MPTWRLLLRSKCPHTCDSGMPLNKTLRRLYKKIFAHMHERTSMDMKYDNRRLVPPIIATPSRDATFTVDEVTDAIESRSEHHTNRSDVTTGLQVGDRWTWERYWTQSLKTGDERHDAPIRPHIWHKLTWNAIGHDVGKTTKNLSPQRLIWDVTEAYRIFGKLCDAILTNQWRTSDRVQHIWTSETIQL